jgi:ABC-type branched-subunit amino acid transport system permease subunit
MAALDRSDRRRTARRYHPADAIRLQSESSTVYYWLVAAIAFPVLILLWRSISDDRLGLAAIRENESARASRLSDQSLQVGVRIVRRHHWPAGSAALSEPHDSADPISVSFSGDLLAMVVIGGMRSFLPRSAHCSLFCFAILHHTEIWLFWFGLYLSPSRFSPTGLVGVGGG